MITGYDTRDVELAYSDAADPDYQRLFGIGPGCIVGPADMPTSTAVPPVREREFAEAFADPNPTASSTRSAPTTTPPRSASLGARLRD